MGKNVAVFVDVANIFYAAKAAGVDIDYVTLLKTASAGRDLVRAYAYTGLDPDNENQRNFHDFLRRHGYKVVSKDIRKYGDGKVKANLDIELVVDMMKTARNLDIAIVVSGDGDFAPAIRAVQEMGIRVEVISFRGNTSSDLIEVADQFTEITQIARVEKGSSRSGRRVAEDEVDLSMTEVPDKQSEGSTTRARGRGRGRGRAGEAEPVAAAPARTRRRVRAPEAPGEAVVGVTAEGTPLVVLPGEKLSRVAAIVAAPAPPAEAAPALDEEPDEAHEGVVVDEGEGTGEEARRRRRRRGGRGRGRGRGREEGLVPSGEAPMAAEDEDEGEPHEPIPAPAPAKRAGFAFGSVWDSQIGMPTSSAAGTPSPARLSDEDDLDEPPIPEYLIAERRQRDGGRGGAPGRGGAGRGSRGAYAAAMDRERFGGGRGAGVNRFAEPAPRAGRGDERPRDDRPRVDRPRGDRPAPRSSPRPAGSGDEPWSEVPPEIEAMLRAQLSGRGTRPTRPEREAEPVAAPSAPAVDAKAAASTPRRRSARPAAPSPETGASPAGAGAAAVPEPVASGPARRTVRRAAPPAASAAVETGPVAEAAPAAPKRRTSRAASPAGAEAGTDTAKPAPTRRASSSKAAPKSAARAAAGSASAVTPPTPAVSAPAADAAPKRRPARKKADATDA
ncbi:MAG TPA: NYN domain-containing protein [Candidatus Sulfomarinibacteraceae bacterium]|nr:NYN domain-containing protein [Candidatus Sulfomarinibacteraceae bacterium]